MKAASAKRHVALVVVAAGAFVLKRSYHGPWAALVRDYGGNLTVSFAVYFLGAIAAASVRLPKAAAVLGALVIVESFELTSGFGLMANVYDPMDLVVNAVGVGVGMLVDHGIGRWARPRAAD
jgi:hypothetical protein